MYEIYCKLRDERGIKDSDVAKGTGITKSTFSDWKNGRSNPKNEKLQKIADYFGVTLDYLMTGTMGNFQNIFKRLRTSSGLTQVEMAKKLNISRSTIGMYETGAREPDFETLEKIADFFNVDTDFLLGRTDKTTLLPETIGHYYLNDETREIAQEAFENPELRTLFKVARDIPPERLRAHIEFMKKLKEQEKGNEGY